MNDSRCDKRLDPTWRTRVLSVAALLLATPAWGDGNGAPRPATEPEPGTTAVAPSEETLQQGLAVESCGLGFWKNHEELWDEPEDPAAAGAGFTTSTDFHAYFGLTPAQTGLPSGLTMHGALQLGGGGKFKLSRHGTAGLLNFGAGLNYQVNGVANEVELQSFMFEAYSSGTYEPLAGTVAAANESGTCPLN